MKKFIGIILTILLVFTVNAEYQIGEVCDNISWTDSNGLETSIYDQIDRGKVVVIFFGQSW